MVKCVASSQPTLGVGFWPPDSLDSASAGGCASTYLKTSLELILHLFFPAHRGTTQVSKSTCVVAGVGLSRDIIFPLSALCPEQAGGRGHGNTPAERKCHRSGPLR